MIQWLDHRFQEYVVVSDDSQWFLDEKFWEYFAPIMFDERRWAEVPAVVEGIAALSSYSFHQSGTATQVVDLCCGLGRISVELAVRGWDVTGVDITRAYLEAARESAEAARVPLELVREDVRQFCRPDSFDLALNLYTSFGYFKDQMDDFAFAKNAYTSLRKGGVFIIETLGKEIAVKDYVHGEWYERAGGIVLTEYQVTEAWEGLRNRWVFLKDGKRIEHCFVQRLYAATELRRLLLEAGFTCVEIFGDWDARPYGAEANKLITVARK